MFNSAPSTKLSLMLVSQAREKMWNQESEYTCLYARVCVCVCGGGGVCCLLLMLHMVFNSMFVVLICILHTASLEKKVVVALLHSLEFLAEQARPFYSAYPLCFPGTTDMGKSQRVQTNHIACTRFKRVHWARDVARLASLWSPCKFDNLRPNCNIEHHHRYNLMCRLRKPWQVVSTCAC